MSKGERLRAARKAEGPKPVPNAIPVEKPSIAKARRSKTRKAFRAWQQLPLATRRAFMRKPENTEIPEESA
jgi:hypothetical protein